MSEAALSALFLQNPQLAIALRRKMEAEGLVKEGSSGEPIRSPWQGVNRLAQGLLGGYQARQADEEIKGGMERDNAEVDSFQKAMAAALMGQGAGGAAPTAPVAPAMPAPPMGGGGAPPSANAQDFIARFAPHAQRVAAETGIDPRLVLAQSALETGWGSKAPGNNFFGIKGPGQTLNTQESVNGQMVPQQASFRAYGSPEESFNDYGAFLKANPRYAPVLGAQGLDAQIEAMGRSGYATDPNYGQKLRMLARGIQLPEAAPQQMASLAPAATDAGGGGGVPRETPPAAPMGAPMQAAPPQSMPGNRSALMDIYLNGISSRNPRVQKIAQGLAPFIKMEQPNLQFQNVGGRILALNPRDGSVVRDLGPSEGFVPLPQSVEDQKRRLAGPTNVAPNSTVLHPVTNQPIYRAPPAPPSTFEEAAARGQAQGGQSATEFRSGQTQATESAQTIQKNLDEQSQRASAAAGRLPMYDRALAGLDKMPPGALMDTRMRIAGLAQELGLNIGDVANLPEAQLRQAIARNLELVMTPKGQGQITESERVLIREQINIMLATPEGTKQILALAKANDTRDIERSGIYRQFMDQSGVIRDVAGLRKTLSEYDAQAPWKGLMLPPPETSSAPNGSSTRAGQRPVVASPADAAKLPPGTEFQTQDGRILRVPMR